MDPMLVSTFVVALAEIGDKTQLLAIVLATRFRKPWPIVAGIFVATIANHALAATAGFFLTDLLEGAWFRYAVALSFIAMAFWTLVPDKFDEKDETRARAGVFLTTLVAFFVVEIGDKTQVATAALAARFHNIEMVTLGTTLGMMLANVPAVFLGEAATRVLPLKYVRIGAALIFFGLGLWQLAELSGLGDRLDDWSIPADGPVTLAIAAVLALTALSYGLRAPLALWHGAASWLRLGAIFAVAKAVLLSAGWSIGTLVSAVGPTLDHWIAFTLLAILGLFTITQSFMRRSPYEEEPQRDSLEVLSFQATMVSLDALIAGLILGMLRAEIGLALLATALLGFVGAAGGAALARHAPASLRRMPELWGGVLFVAIGAVILFQHLSAA
jgi:putative Ca2+/H+ antiporter (TMEM165/GDT1 family)